MPTDLARVPDPLSALARLPAGAAVILRDAGHPARRDWAGRLRQATAARGLLLLIANDPALAQEVGADGLHLAEAETGRIAPWRFTTGAAHSLAALRRAEQAGLHAALLSPVLATASHPGAPALGLGRARAMAQAARLPVYGMGGLDPVSARRLGPSFAGFAAIAGLA